jgi:hypothetical protein
MSAPQAPQKRDGAGIVAEHEGQDLSSAAPQLPQNRKSMGLDAPQFPHPNSLLGSILEVCRIGIGRATCANIPVRAGVSTRRRLLPWAP